MKPAATIGIIIGIIIIIVVGLIAYSYTQIQISLEGVSYQGLVFASPSASTIFKLAADLITGNWLGLALTLVTGVKLGLVFGLSNHGFFPVYIPDISYDILVNGVKVGQGQSHIDSTINPGETRSFQDNTQDIQFSGIEPAITSIVDSGGIANFQVSGTAYFNFLGINVPVPFQQSRQVNIVDEIKNQINRYISQNQQYSNNQPYSQNQQYSNNQPYSQNQYSNNPTSDATQSLEQQLQLAKNKINTAIANNQQLVAPIPLLPLNGWVFNNYPRTTTLVWLPVIGASSYTVEIEYWDQGTSEWHVYQTIQNIQGTTYTFNFIGAQSGSWRVWSVNNLGQNGPSSNWWQFRYTQ